MSFYSMIELSFRAVIMYFVLFLIMRLMGKREVGNLSVFDLVISFMLASLSSVVLEEDASLMKAIVPITTLGLLQVFLAWISLKSKKFRDFIDGEPTVIVKDGKLLDHNMAKIRYNVDDLMTQLREKKIASVSDVEFAILETSGKLSVFPKLTTPTLFRLPIPVIIEGKVQLRGLEQTNRSVSWLKLEIMRRGYSEFRDIYYASIDNEGKLFVDGVNES